MAYKKNNSSEKDAFLIHNSQYQAVRNFSNEDYGKLFHAICRYHIKEDIGDLDDKIQVAFEFFKVQFEYDREKWEKIRESRSASGKKGGRPKSKPKQTNANQSKSSQIITLHQNCPKIALQNVTTFSIFNIFP